jgi:hypothetical protein
MWSLSVAAEVSGFVTYPVTTWLYAQKPTADKTAFTWFPPVPILAVSVGHTPFSTMVFLVDVISMHKGCSCITPVVKPGLVPLQSVVATSS